MWGNCGPRKQLSLVTESACEVLGSPVALFPCGGFCSPGTNETGLPIGILGEDDLGRRALGAGWSPSLIVPPDLEFEFQLSQELF